MRYQINIIRNMINERCLCLTILRAKKINSDRDISERIFAITLTYDGIDSQTRFQTGDNLQWNQAFILNINPSDNQSLIINLHVDQEILGTKTISISKKNQSLSQGYHTIKMENHGKCTAQLDILCQYDSNELLGGIEPPKISIKPGQQLPAPFDSSGLELNNASRVNLFSFLDHGICNQAQSEFQLFPDKFKSKCTNPSNI